jgi:hypothetical protein
MAVGGHEIHNALLADPVAHASRRRAAGPRGVSVILTSGVCRKPQISSLRRMRVSGKHLLHSKGPGRRISSADLGLCRKHLGVIGANNHRTARSCPSGRSSFRTDGRSVTSRAPDSCVPAAARPTQPATGVTPSPSPHLPDRLARQAAARFIPATRSICCTTSWRRPRRGRSHRRP